MSVELHGVCSRVDLSGYGKAITFGIPQNTTFALFACQDICILFANLEARLYFLNQQSHMRERTRVKNMFAINYIRHIPCLNKKLDFESAA